MREFLILPMNNSKRGETVKSNHKIVWLKILQGWAMLWVVIGHAGPANTPEESPNWAHLLWNFAYSFHMPLFVMISGFLFYLTRISNKKWTYWSMMREKLIRFGIPFIVFTIFTMVIKSVFSSEVERPTTVSLSEFINAILYPYNGPMREFWFIGVIMWMFVLFPVWKITLKYYSLMVLTSVVLVAFYFVVPINHFLALYSVGKSASFFWWGLLVAKLYDGYMSGKIKWRKRFFNNTFSKRGGQISILVISIVLYLLSVYCDYSYLQAVFGIILSLALCLLLYGMRSESFNSFRDYTYQIYLMGILAQEIVKLITYKFGLPYGVMYIISIIAGLYVPVLISWLVNEINIKPLKLCIGLKH